MRSFSPTRERPGYPVETMLLHVIDGTFELFRAHYSKRPDQRGADGRDVKATAGFVSSMLWLLGDPDERATHVAVAFDNPIESFRNELFDGYKTGAGIEEALRAQFDLAEDAARALGLVVWSMDRWEADDALATAAARWGDQVEQVRILTPDKDLGQCVRGEHIVQVDVIRRRVIDEKAVVNGIVGLHATGGSTNHTLHLVAMARAAGIAINWDDFAALSDVVPLVARIYPNGLADVNHFQAAGGLGFLIAQLLDAGLLHGDVRTVSGAGLKSGPWASAADSATTVAAMAATRRLSNLLIRALRPFLRLVLYP